MQETLTTGLCIVYKSGEMMIADTLAQTLTSAVLDFLIPCFSKCLFKPLCET